MNMYPGRNSGTQQTLLNSMNELLRLTKQFHAVLNPKLGTVGSGPQIEAYRVVLSNEDKVTLNQINNAIQTLDTKLYYETLSNMPEVSTFFNYYGGAVPDNPSGNPNVREEVYFVAGSPVLRKTYSWDIDDNVVAIVNTAN